MLADKIKLNSNLAVENWFDSLEFRSLTQPFLIDPGDNLTNDFFIKFIKFVSQNDVTIQHLINFLVKSIEVDEVRACEIITDLINEGLILRESNDNYLEEQKYSFIWNKCNNRVSSLFHQKTNNLSKIDYSNGGQKKDNEFMQKYVERETPPSNYKQVSSELIHFPDPTTIFPEKANLVSIQSLYNPGFTNSDNVAFNFENLGSYLYYLVGQIGYRSLHVTGLHVAKTSPSGGSRHPTEAYLEIFNIEGINPGLYHYDVKNHALALISADEICPDIVNSYFQYSHPAGFKSRFIIYFSCVFERSMFRYRESRSYRVMQIDLGHLIQTAVMLSNSYGWRSFRSYAPPEKDIESRINIDGISESVMSLIAVGDV